MAVINQFLWNFGSPVAPSGYLAATALALIGALAGGIVVYAHMYTNFARRLRKTERIRQVVQKLLDTPETNGQRWIAAILEQLACSVDADRAWLLLGTDAATGWNWSNDHIFALADAVALTQSATARFPWRDDCIFIETGCRGEIVPDTLGWHRISFSVNTILLRSEMNGENAVFGLKGQWALRVEPEMTQALKTVLGVVLQTLRRHEGKQRQVEYEREAAIGRRMETIGTLASGMAHNLNNIIAAIAGFNAIIEMQVASDSIVGQSVVDINIAVRRAQAMVREVLNFGRRLERMSSDIDVSELLSETAAMLTVSLPNNILLQADKPAEPWRVLGNFGHLQQVMMNISFNAAQSMTTGGTIRWGNRYVLVKEPLQTSCAIIDPGPYVAISIRDEGIGISPKIMARIFDPFFTTRANGTGLGLSTARDIVEQHGGTIDVWTMPGEGSIFTLWLPATFQAASEEEDPAPCGGGEIVLVINTDTARLAIDEELVAALGYEPSGLWDTGAIDDFEGYVDMVLIAGMEELSVTAALDAVRQAKWRVPILVATKQSATIMPAPSLSYPLRPVELASALSQALTSLETRVIYGAERGRALTVTRP